MSSFNLLEVNRHFCHLRGQKSLTEINTNNFLYSKDGCGFYTPDNFNKVVFFEIFNDEHNTLDFRPTYLMSYVSRRPFPGNLCLKETHEYVTEMDKKAVITLLSDLKIS